MRTLNSNAIPRQLLIPTRYQGLARNGTVSGVPYAAEFQFIPLYEKHLRLSGRESEALWENRSYPHRRDARIFAHWVSSFCVVNSSQVWQLCMAEAMTMPGIPW